MELQTIEQTTPLLAQPPANLTPGLVSVRFCVHKDAGCCPWIFKCDCCQEKIENAVQIVVPDTTTVGEFLHIVSQMGNAKEEYGMAFINDFQLNNNDLIAPTIRSFEKFTSPIVVFP